MSGSLLPKTSHILFAKNKGQWNSKVLYEGKFKGGKVFLEKQGFSYIFYPKNGLESIHHKHHVINGSDSILTFHSVKMEFVNCSKNSVIKELDSNSFFENYFIGNNPAKWASNVKSYKQIIYENLYRGINVKAFSDKNNFRYDFIIEPGADIEQLAMSFKGQNYLRIVNGNLIINTQNGDVSQNAPYAYQTINEKVIKIKCEYVLEKDIVKLKIGSNYDKRFELIIDPTLVFASYTGSLSDNWGMTATYDSQGNAYTAGMSFGLQYPLSVGAFQANYMGGTFVGGDISVSKFNSSGTTLLYSTYLGGTDIDSPQSIVVDNLGQLVVFGRTLSTDFPVTTGVIQITNAGANDLIVTKFNTTGTALIASTYIGGSLDDGVNGGTSMIFSPTTVLNGLHYNYSDDLRGSVIVDDSNNVYIAASTTSANFPVTSGCFQNALKGSQDACITKLKADLSSLIFSTYYGGSGMDGVYDIALNNSNELYVTGGTESTDFHTTAGSLHSTSQGAIDGFISLFSFNGNAVLASTYVGTSAYDQSFFIQLDKQNRVYVFGQTEGNYPVSAGVYSNPNSGQFIHCLNSNLTSSLFSTVVGSGDGFPDISPSAFLVDVCGSIYLSGWGGTLSTENNANSSTFGLPITPNAFMSATDGSDFYFMVLNRDALSLQYATFFGGSASLEHVDGGTSRFDKSGVIYQAICESCGGNDDMPATPTAWSTQNGSTNCNNAVVKFSFSSNLTVAQISPIPNGCAPYVVNFVNHSTNGVNYFWDFGDGTTSTAFSPSHTYTANGVYNVQLISSNNATCNMFDTTFTTVTLKSPPGLTSIQKNMSGCVPSILVNFINNNNPALNYFWNFGDGSSSSAFAPSHTYTTTGIYTIQLISNNVSCNVHDTVYTSINVTPPFNLPPVPVINMCLGDSVSLNLIPPSGCTYTWTPNTLLNNANLQQPKASPPGDVLFKVTVEQSGCIAYDSVKVLVFNNDTKILLNPSHACIDDTVKLSANHVCTSYQWSNGQNTPQINVFQPNLYYLSTIKNNCRAKDSIRIDSFAHVSIHTQTLTLCLNEKKQLFAPLGSYIYDWQPNYKIDTTTIYNPVVSPKQNTTYTLTIYNGPCISTGTYHVKVHALPTLTVTPKTMEVFFGEIVELSSLSDTISNWEPGNLLSCTFCNNSMATSQSSMTYYATVKNKYGCVAKDSVEIKVTPTLYIPNSFSPNGDLINDIFKPEYIGFIEIELLIFDRWGVQIFKTNDLNGGWNGKYKEGDCQMGVYIYKLSAKDIFSKTLDKVGHVTLIR